MMYLELSKKYVKEWYGNNIQAAVNALDGIVFDDEKVRKTFGNGWKGFFRCMNANKQYCYYIKL